MLDGCFYGTESKPLLLQQLSNRNVGTTETTGQALAKSTLNNYFVICNFHLAREIDELLKFYLLTTTALQCFIQQIGQEP